MEACRYSNATDLQSERHIYLYIYFKGLKGIFMYVLYIRNLLTACLNWLKKLPVDGWETLHEGRGVSATSAGQCAQQRKLYLDSYSYVYYTYIYTHIWRCINDPVTIIPIVNLCISYELENMFMLLDNLCCIYVFHVHMIHHMCMNP